MKNPFSENARTWVSKRSPFRILTLATLTMTSVPFANSWVHGKAIQEVEVGPGYVQIQTTESSNFNYYYKASDANNPGNNLDGMKIFLALVLSAQASGSPINLLVSNPGADGEFASAASIGNMK